MQTLRYALVAYIKSPLGEFVESLQRELHPGQPHLTAHLTILPPRLLTGTESSALETLEKICGDAEPFEVQLGDMQTFMPVTPTVYIRVASGMAQVSQLHDRLNVEALAFKEEWAFIPHVTIVKMAAEDPARKAFKIATERWKDYSGTRRILVERLTFVREDSQNCWADLAPVSLRRLPASR